MVGYTSEYFEQEHAGSELDMALLKLIFIETFECDLRKFRFGGKNPDIFAQKFNFEAHKGVLPMGGGVLRNPTCQVLISKFRDRKPSFVSFYRNFSPSEVPYLGSEVNFSPWKTESRMVVRHWLA